MTYTAGLIDRYQDYRVRRWMAQERHTAGKLMSWRPRHRRRLLVGVVAVSLLVVAAAGVVCALDMTWGVVLATVALVVFLPSWTMLRIVSGRHDNAPDPILDEMEIAERNKARSIGLALTQTLTLPPVAYLIVAGTFAPEAGAFRTAYAGGLMMLAALMAGGCAPAMILGWTRPDLEPEA